MIKVKIINNNSSFDTSCKRGFAEDCLEVHGDRADHLSNNLRLQEISILIFFSVLLQNKQKTITNSCWNNLRSKLILILSKTEFKTLRTKPTDEEFRDSSKFPRHWWNQRISDFNRFSNKGTRSCYSCLVLWLHGSQKLRHSYCILR